MKGIVYVHISDGEYTYKVDHDNKTYKLVYYDGDEFEIIPKGAKHEYSEVSSIKFEYPSYKEITPANQNPFFDEQDIAIMKHYEDKYDTSAQDIADNYGYDNDGQPDDEKELSDLEGPELPSEE